MASARFAWGIDIGNRALKAVKLVRDGNQLRVDDFELIEHEHVLSNAGDNRESLIQTALANFVQRHPTKGGVVAVGVSGQSSFARFIKLPPVEEKKIPEIVRFEAIQQIPFPLDDVEWSYQLFRSPESPDVEVGIFAMRKELINHHIKYFTDFDMNVQVVQMNPLAVYNAMFYDQRLKGTTMVIDLGAENTDLIICDNDTIWMRSIPIGGNNFTETLVKGFKLPFSKAEDLKRNAATSKYARQIFQAMRPVFADLVAEIQRSVGFYASVHRDSRIKRIIALGGTFRLPGLQKYLQQNLSLDVDRMDTVTAGAPEDPKMAATFNENLLSAIGAYGLAIQAMGEGKITSSLLPTAIRREKMWKEKVPWFATAAAIFCVGTGIAAGGYFMQNYKLEQSAADKQANDATNSKAQDLDSQWSAIESSGTGDRTELSNILSLTDGRDLWRHILRDIQNALPVPQKEVLDGLKNNDPASIKKIPRTQRNQLVIESISSLYVPNMTPILAQSDQDFLKNETQGTAINPTLISPDNPAGGVGGGDQPDNGGGAPAVAQGGGNGPRGFVITVKGTSPNGNAANLLQAQFFAALKKIKPTVANPKIEYSIERTVIGQYTPVRQDQTRLEQMKTAYDAIMKDRTAPNSTNNQPAQPLANPNGQPVDDPAPYLDRVVNDEDTRDDTEFTALIAVLIDPPPPQPAAQPQAAAR